MRWSAVSEVAGPTLFLDLGSSLVWIERIGSHWHIVRGMIEKSLGDHVSVVKARDGEWGRKSFDGMIIVVFLRIGVLVFVERITPLPTAPSG
jgi:hypothetical protein